MSHSKAAVWLAMDSEYADRLIEILNEHVKLARAYEDMGEVVSREIIAVRIDKLREERDSIISKFEDKIPVTSGVFDPRD